MGKAMRTFLLGGLCLLGAGAPASSEDPRTVPDPRWGAFFAGTDQRVPIEPTAWPWYAIGRVNIADSVSRRHCTGTLVGAQLGLTAGHCLFDHRLGRWVKPEHVHFVAGQARDSARGHAAAVALIVPPELDMASGSDPAQRTLRLDLVAHDWALVRLEAALSIKPVPVKAILAGAAAQEVGGSEIARAGYSADRRYLLSVHRGCAAALGQGGTLLNRCDALPGDSGSPLLLLRGDQAFIIGLSTGAQHMKRADTGYVAVTGLGPSATAFEAAVAKALAP
ncbi:MAG TPA: trypsin-like peptidase domain-containing protein [Hyphomicrobiaceae bacterium]|nr:trypsin-like peptidase domain-containing protein [Hyphomicrobiaceae bacterium]